MYNVDVEVVGKNNDVIWRKALSSALYNPSGFKGTPFRYGND